MRRRQCLTPCGQNVGRVLLRSWLLLLLTDPCSCFAVSKSGIIAPDMEAYVHSPPAERPVVLFGDEPDVAIVEQFGVLPEGDAFVAKIATHDGTVVHLGTFPRRHTAMQAYDAAHALLGDFAHNLPAGSPVLTTVRRRRKCVASLRALSVHPLLVLHD